MITCRQATIEDAKLVFDWSNDPETRKNSFNSEPIEWDGHLSWFEQRLKQEDMILIFEAESIPIGMVRFSFSENNAVIGVIVDPANRGKNYGAQIIALGSSIFSKKHPVTSICAFIKKENIGSIKSFEKANFKFVKNLDVQGHSSVEMKYSK
jgi:RimJ/RimL family protein N-acetyltransferase